MLSWGSIEYSPKNKLDYSTTMYILMYSLQKWRKIIVEQSACTISPAQCRVMQLVKNKIKQDSDDIFDSISRRNKRKTPLSLIKGSLLWHMFYFMFLWLTNYLNGDLSIMST